MKQRRTQLRRTFGVMPMIFVLALGLLLAACGNDNTGGEPAVDGAQTAAPTNTGSSTGASQPTSAAQPSAAAAGGATVDAIKKRGVLRVGVKYDAPPFGSLDPATNKVTGFDVDVARGVAAAILGDENKVQLVQVTSKNRIPLLQNGQIDMFAATATITKERLGQINFSDVYYRAGQSLLVKKGSDIKTYKDLSGKNVCTVTGSTPEQTIRRLVPDAKVTLFETYPECLTSLRNGRIDAITTDNVLLNGMQQQDPENLEMVGDLFTFEPYGLGIAKGNAELTTAVNEALDGMKDKYEALFKEHLDEPLPDDFDEWFSMPAAEAAQKFEDQQAK